jgi:hypothetical protein
LGPLSLSYNAYHGLLFRAIKLPDSEADNSLSFEAEEEYDDSGAVIGKKRKVHAKRFFPPSDEEILVHAEFLKSIQSPLWNEC